MVDAPSGGGPEQAQDGISRIQKVAAVELGFGSCSDCLGAHVYIYEEEVRWRSNMGPTRVEGAPRG